METSNVNNLNGIPNFGHGLPEEVKVEAEEVVTSEEVITPETSVETPTETSEVLEDNTVVEAPGDADTTE